MIDEKETRAEGFKEAGGIPVTCALPLHNSRRVGFPLSSLARLHEEEEPVARPPWELILYEDPSAFYQGPDRFFQDHVLDALMKAGCVRVKYLYWKNFVPLSIKWKRMAEHASEDSRAFMLYAHDDIYSPDRISDAFLALCKKPDNAYEAHTYHSGYFWDFNHRSLIRYERPSQKTVGLSKSFRTDIIRALPEEKRKSSVDSWICATGGVKSVMEEFEETFALHTNGRNVISTSREWHFFDPEPPYYPCDKGVFDILPFEMAASVLEERPLL